MTNTMNDLVELTNRAATQNDRWLHSEHLPAWDWQHARPGPRRPVSRLAQVRNRKVNEALIQGVETARAVLETTPQGQASDAAFVKWLMEHQKEAGVFTTVSTLVDDLTDNPAAKQSAQEILERVRRAQATSKP